MAANVIVGIAAKQPSDWVPEPSLLDCEPIAAILAGVAIAHASDDDLRLAVQAIRRTGQQAGHYLDTLRQMPIARDTCTCPADLELGDTSGACLASIPVHPRVLRALTVAMPGVHPDTDIDGYYKAHLHPLGSRAQRVIVFDAYMDARSLGWFLRQCDRDGVPDIHVFTSDVARLDEVRRASAPYRGRGQLTVAPSSQFPHGRHLRYQFGSARKSISIVLDKGMATFNPPRVGAYHVGKGDHRTARENENTARSYTLSTTSAL